ncbi:KGK domain-containing protein [Okeania sp.]|uniref:KGK domain-containing protein n=1 Tax=Okeania sp. TaxID=3100323 RepID=UPI002B4B57E2|nr:KGK domain-containing protein [Okeania sp.]MEB3343076.1 KGK domain-containing protein [Okeania sp.]
MVVEKVRSSFYERPLLRQVNQNFNQNINSLSIFGLLGRNIIKIVDKSVALNLRDILLIFTPEGIECKILKLGNSEWETGKAIINLTLKNASDVLVKLEFCYDEPPQPESPLDDIRQREDYQQLLNNQ